MFDFFCLDSFYWLITAGLRKPNLKLFKDLLRLLCFKKNTFTKWQKPWNHLTISSVKTLPGTDSAEIKHKHQDI